jgi:hypothetical protein
MDQKMGGKSQKSSVLDPAKVHFCHLTIEILELMHSDQMVNIPLVFPVPDVKFVKLVLGRYH